LVKHILFGLLFFGLVELALLVKAGEVFGTWFPIAAVVLSMAAGVFLIRYYGLQTLRRVAEILRTGLPPVEHPSAGLVGVLAGILLILPGFLSDLCAILLLVPAARRRIASLVGWRAHWVASGRRRARACGKGPVIEAEAVEILHESGSTPPVERASPWRR
jgi:UPF0716 protein FxsA